MTLFKDHKGVDKLFQGVQTRINARIRGLTEDQILGTAPALIAGEAVTAEMLLAPTLDPSNYTLERTTGQIHYRVRVMGDSSLMNYVPTKGDKLTPKGDKPTPPEGMALAEINSPNGWVEVSFRVAAGTSADDIEKEYRAWVSQTEEWLSWLRSDLADLQDKQISRITRELTRRQDAIRREQALFDQLEARRSAQGEQ